MAHYRELCVSTFCFTPTDTSKGGTARSHDVIDRPKLASAELVSIINSTPMGQSEDARQQPPPVIQPQRSDTPLIIQPKVAFNRVANHGDKEEAGALSTTAQELIHGSIRDSTRNSYRNCWNRWVHWSKQQSCDPSSPTECHLVNYLASLFREGLGANSISLHKSAIVSILVSQNSKYQGLLQSDKLRRVIRGAFNLIPPRQVTTVWNVDTVLSYWISAGSNSQLSKKQLFQKTLSLLCLVTACRVSELASLSGIILKFPTYWQLQFTKWKKNSSQKKAGASVDIFFFKADSRLCPIQCLEYYLDRTSLEREGVNSIFLTLSKPIRRPRPNTLATHLKQVLASAGVDTSKFTAHSFRAAASSKAAASAISIQDILKRATWSSESTFTKFYHKEVSQGKAFSEAVIL
jgi:integrase